MKHHKNYTNTTEDQFRYQIWLNSSTIIKNHNIDYRQGKTTFIQGENDLSDLTPTEYKNFLNLAVPSNNESPYYVPPKLNNIHLAAPLYVNWSAKGYTTPVKNQFQCGACWSFSSTGAIEGQLFKNTGQLISLSEQNLIDCTQTVTYKNNGCSGGNMGNAFRYIIDNNGIDTETSYPYNQKDTNSCQYSKANRAATVTQYYTVQPNETALQQVLASIGPIAVGIDAHLPSFMHYSSGIYINTDGPCGDTLDHAVLLVGYGTLNGQDYWYIKNQWGTTWGINGYAMIARNAGNVCGIASYALFPVVQGVGMTTPPPSTITTTAQSDNSSYTSSAAKKTIMQSQNAAAILKTSVLKFFSGISGLLIIVTFMS